MKKKSANSLNYNSLKDQLKKDLVYTVYIIHGDDDYLIEQSISDIRNKLEELEPELEYSSYYSDSSKITEILDIANSLGLFSKKKLVVIKQCEKLHKSDTEYLLNYVNNPNKQTILVLIFENLKNFKIEPSENLISVNIPSDPKNIILTVKKEAENQGYIIKNDAIQKLIELVGENLIDLIGEIKKLAINQSNGEIEKSDVENYITKSSYNDVFELVNAVCNKDKKLALKVLKDLEDIGEEPISVINRISWRIRSVWQVKELLDKKVSKEQILKELKISSGNLYYIQKQVNNFTYDELKKALNSIYNADIKLKSTQVPRYDVLTSTVIEMIN